MSEIKIHDQNLKDMEPYRELLAELKLVEKTAHFQRTNLEEVMGESFNYFEEVDQLYRKLGYSAPVEWFAGQDLQERIAKLDWEDLSSLSERVDNVAMEAIKPVPANADGDVIAALNNKLTLLKGYIDLRKRKLKD